MYLFPRVTITNYHELSGLTQEEFILLHIWRLDVQNDALSSAMVPWRFQGRILASGDFQWSLVLPDMYLSASLQSLPLSLHHLLLSVFYLLSSCIKTPLFTFRAHPITPAVITLIFISDTIFLSFCLWTK